MANNSKPVIMIVDDDPCIGKMLTMFLDGQGYRVIFFTDGNKALVYLENNTVNFLLTDMQMPEMSGLELLRQVRTLWRRNAMASKAPYPTLPALVMSGLPAATLAAQAGSAGGNALDEIFSLGADFIPKPFDLVDLLKHIRGAAGATQCKRINLQITRAGGPAHTKGFGEV